MIITYTTAGTDYLICAGAAAGQAVSGMKGRFTRRADVVTSASGNASVFPAGSQLITLAFDVTGDDLAVPPIGGLGKLALTAPDDAWALFTPTQIQSVRNNVIAGRFAGKSYSFLMPAEPIFGSDLRVVFFTDGLGRLLSDGTGFVLVKPFIS